MRTVDVLTTYSLTSYLRSASVTTPSGEKRFSNGRSSASSKKPEPKLSKAAAVAIVKIILPRIDPNEDLAGYKNMGTCVDWLANLARGTDWETELDAVRSEYCNACKEAQPRLF